MELRTSALRLAKQVPAYASLAAATDRAAASSVVEVIESATGGQKYRSCCIRESDGRRA